MKYTEMYKTTEFKFVWRTTKDVGLHDLANKIRCSAGFTVWPKKFDEAVELVDKITAGYTSIPHTNGFRFVIYIHYSPIYHAVLLE